MISSFVIGERNSIGSSFEARKRNFSTLMNLRNTCEFLNMSDTPDHNLMQSTFNYSIRYLYYLNDGINCNSAASHQL